MKQFYSFLLFLSLFIFAGMVSAAPIEQSNTQEKPLQKTQGLLSSWTDSVNVNTLNAKSYQALSEQAQNSIAQAYQLTPKDYITYLQINQSTPIGQTYKDRNMNPNFILADYYLQQGNAKESNHYIRNLVRMEHDEAQRLLTIQRRFQHFAQQIYVNETPIQLKGTRPLSYISYGAKPKLLATNNLLNPNLSLLGISSHAIYVFLVDSNDDVSYQPKLKALLNKLVNKKAVRLDIYFLNNVTRDQIINWVTANTLAPYLRSKLVTVNFKGKFISSLSDDLHRQLKSGELFKNQQGIYRQMNWADVL